MDKPVKDWGVGIPKYTKEDLLQGIELHAFCTVQVASSMQEDGYTIEGIITNNTPTQVIANKDGKRYFVIVAGDIYPLDGKISFDTKMRFSLFCKRQGVVPMFASVGLRASDQERAEAGLALKYDGYYVKYVGNEDLTNVTLPSKDSKDYKAYCVEKIVRAYETGEFGILYDDFADNIQFHSQWVFEPIIGKEKLIDYYNAKGNTLRNSNSALHGGVVAISQKYKRNGQVMIMSEPGKLCAVIGQELNGQSNWIFVSPEFNDNNQLVKIALNDPELFSFAPYYAY